MTVHLTPHAEKILCELLAQQPERSSEELVEQALNAIADRACPKRGLNALSDEDFEAWLDAMAFYSDQIPPMPGETFSREMIYKDHD